jgi:hypothetical protein
MFGQPSEAEACLNSIYEFSPYLKENATVPPVGLSHLTVEASGVRTNAVKLLIGQLFTELSCVGRGLCDWLIAHPEESYRVSVCV